jgi:hypothetical protein
MKSENIEAGNVAKINEIMKMKCGAEHQSKINESENHIFIAGVRRRSVDKWRRRMAARMAWS